MTHHATLDPNTLVLAKGGHMGGPPPGDPDCELCLFEAYNVLTTPHDVEPEITDERPADVSRVLHRFGIRLNDLLGDDRRQDLKKFLPQPDGTSLLAGTAGDGFDEMRRFMAVDWAVRWATPRWLDAAGQPERAAQLRALAPIVDPETRNAMRPALYAIRAEMWALRRAKLADIRQRSVAVAVAVAVAAADAVADAAADAVADAVAVAVAVAAAVADADAVAVAAADAVADADAVAVAVAVAVADADADADAVADADGWSKNYHAAYAAARARIEERFASVIAEVHASALDLFERMIHPVVPS